QETPPASEGELVGAADRHPVARPLSVFPAETVDELLLLIEVLLRRFLVVVVRQQEIEPVDEWTLHTKLQRVIALAGSVCVHLLDGAVLRKWTQQALQRHGPLVAQRAAHLIFWKQLVEGIRNLLVKRCALAVDDLRIHLVEVERVRAIAAGVEEVR